MSSLSGKKYTIDIFGESHSRAIGVVIGGVPAGTPIKVEDIDAFLSRRRPSDGVHSTTRREKDAAEILSGVLDGFATGAPIAVIIENADTRSSDYESLKGVFRPSHSDYAAYVKYGGFNDVRGGGQFSGRLTAPLCAAGSIALNILRGRGVEVTAYISRVGAAKALSYKEVGDVEAFFTADKIREIKSAECPLLDKSRKDAIIEEIAAAAKVGDSVGGIIECVITGLPAGVGEPNYDGLEGLISKILFAVPAVKGVEFGVGFDISAMRGSVANDALYFDGDRVKTRTNNCGGITGGISNGMPITFGAAFKPVPSIYAEQDTIDIKNRKNTKLSISGRHDACIVPRAVPVVEAAAACALLDLLI
ncbi:MAG: chorismate synthase [Clostridiales bacterium]|jgi:chorismate synthase|nr:chorismate synthase [Clostridiales bacterium]